MSVELEGSTERALFKRCIWMSGDVESSEGAQDEASKHSAHRCSSFSNACAQCKEPSNCWYM